MAAHQINVHDELAEAKVSGFHIRLAVITGLLTLFDGYDVFNPAYVIHFVVGPWGLKGGQIGLLSSSGLIGFMIGATVHGLIADRMGRRGTLLAGAWITSVFTLLTAILGNSFASFCLLRVLTGLGLGILLPLATTYIIEIAPRRVAYTFAIFGIVLGYALGGTIAGLVGVFATPAFGWKVLYWIGSLSFILLPIMHAWLPESPKFLILAHRSAEVKALLARLRPERATIYGDANLTVAQPPAASRSPKVILTKTYRRTTIAIWTSAFISLFSIFGLAIWLPTVLIQRGVPFSVSFGIGAANQFMQFVGALSISYLADRFGTSRGLMAVWWVFAGICALVPVVSDNQIAVLISVTLIGLGFSAQHLLNSFTATCYETSVRATAVGMTNAIARVGAILGPLAVGVLQEIYPGPTPMFVLIAVSIMAAGATILLAGGSSIEREKQAHSSAANVAKSATA